MDIYMRNGKKYMGIDEIDVDEYDNFKLILYKDSVDVATVGVKDIYYISSGEN